MFLGARVSNRAFPRTGMGPTPAFEGWGEPSRILGRRAKTRETQLKLKLAIFFGLA